MIANHNDVRRSLADAHRGHARSLAKRANNMTSRTRRERFAQAYVEHLDARRAAKEAGYRPEYGVRVLRNPDVQTRIQALLEQTARSVTKQSVIIGLLKEALYHGEGSSHAARVNAWAKLGDALGLGAQHVQRHLHVLSWIRDLDVVELDALEKLDDEQLVRALEQRELPTARTDLDGPNDAALLPTLLETDA